MPDPYQICFVKDVNNNYRIIQGVELMKRYTNMAAVLSEWKPIIDH